MTINYLQKCIMEDMEKALEDIQLKGAAGAEKRIKAYPQALPIIRRRPHREGEGYQPNSDEPDRENELFPYAIVRVTGAKYTDEGATATIDIVFGVYNEDEMMAGYFELLNVLERTRGHYQSKSILDYFWCENEMEIAIQEDDTYPYFFGGIEMTWNLPLVEREALY